VSDCAETHGYYKESQFISPYHLYTDQSAGGNILHLIVDPSGGISIDTILAILGVAVGLVGGVYGYLGYRQSRRIKQLSYDTWTRNLVTSETEQIDELIIQYGASRLKGLNESYVLLWNHGNTAITEADIGNASPIKLECDSSQTILKISPWFTDPGNVEVDLPADFGGTSASLRVRCIERRKGIIFHVLHGGPDNSKPFFVGNLIDYGPPQKRRSPVPWSLEAAHGDGIAWYAAILAATILILSFEFIRPLTGLYFFMPNVVILSALIVMMYIAFGGLLSRKKGRDIERWMNGLYKALGYSEACVRFGRKFPTDT